MQILDFSKERGIHAIFNGYGKQAYIFHSSFYGFVGYADIDEKYIGCDEVTVDVYLCQGSKIWYWSLRSIVTKGIRKAERQWKSDKNVTINIHWLDKFNGETPNYEGSIGRPCNDFKIELYDGVMEVQ